MLLHANIYWPKEIPTLLCPYTLKYFADQLNVIKVDNDGLTPMEKFEGTATDITIKIHHKRGCTVYVLDSILQGSISGLHKWEPLSLAGIYFVHSLFHAVSVALVLNT